MLSRFTDKAALVESLVNQKLVMGDDALAAAIASRVTVHEVAPEELLIAQGGFDDAIYFILAGTFSIVVNEEEVAQRTANDYVGEMSIVLPSLPRSATVVALESGVVAKLLAVDLIELGNAYPRVWRQIAKTLADRLYQRNALLRTVHESIRVFIISSLEALPLARAVENNFAHDPFFCKVWTDGVFRASPYAIESLEHQLDETDFAIAIAQPDGKTTIGGHASSPRDNIIFELGLCVGRLGRHRSFLLEPKEDDIILSSDLSGFTTIHYRPGPSEDLGSLLGPACKQLRRIFVDLGPAH
jgi:predicted nucleotide-binding protein